MIIERGGDAVTQLPTGLREHPEAMAETIENNVRRLIIDEMAVNPKYYETMSELLDALIKERKQQAMDYQAYLKKIVALTQQVHQPQTGKSYPLAINSPARQALYDNLKNVEGLAEPANPENRVAEASPDIAEAAALTVDEAIRRVKKDGWRDNRFKQIEVHNAIKAVLGDVGLVDKIFEIVKNQRDY